MCKEEFIFLIIKVKQEIFTNCNKKISTFKVDIRGKYIFKALKNYKHGFYNFPFELNITLSDRQALHSSVLMTNIAGLKATAQMNLL